MVVRVEYDRSNRVCIAYEGQVIGLLCSRPGGQFFCRGRVPLPPLPLEPALEETFTFLSPSCIVASDRPWTTLSTRMPINKIWRRTEPTPRSRWWRNHVAGIYSDCAALAHGLNSTQLTDLTQTELNWTLEFLGSAMHLRLFFRSRWTNFVCRKRTSATGYDTIRDVILTCARKPT